MTNSDDYEMTAEIDFSKVKVLKAGKGRKWLAKDVPNPDYDPQFDPARHFRYVLLRAREDAEEADTETGVDGKLAPVAPAGAVMLDADIAAVFTNAAAVNTALRMVIKMADEASLPTVWQEVR